MRTTCAARRRSSTTSRPAHAQHRRSGEEQGERAARGLTPTVRIHVRHADDIQMPPPADRPGPADPGTGDRSRACPPGSAGPAPSGCRRPDTVSPCPRRRRARRSRVAAVRSRSPRRSRCRPPTRRSCPRPSRAGARRRNLGAAIGGRPQPGRGHPRVAADLAPGVRRPSSPPRCSSASSNSPGRCGAGRFRPPLVPLLVGSLAMEALAWTRGSTGLVVGFFSPRSPSSCGGSPTGPPATSGTPPPASSSPSTCRCWPVSPSSCCVPDDGGTRVLAFIATVVASDVGGYAAGVLFGKHPMAPSISPKKSWEGLAGSVLACMLVATPLIALGLHGPWWGGAVFGAASARLGDRRRPRRVADQARPRHQGHGHTCCPATAV